MRAASALVTGASGFIGAHLVARLLSEGADVTVLARSSSQLPIEWRERVRIVVSDDFSESGLRRLLNEPFESVFHLAAYGVKPNHRDIEEILRINVELADGPGADVCRMARPHGDGGHLLGVSKSICPVSAYGGFASGAGQTLRLVKGCGWSVGERDRPYQRRRVSSCCVFSRFMVPERRRIGFCRRSLRA